MSNGPYGQTTCRCGAVSLLVCGAPLALGRDAGGEPVSFWPLVAIQLGQGADELEVSPSGTGGDAWQCRRCAERLLLAHDDDDLAVLAEQEGADEIAPALTPVQQRWLEALGYRVAAGE
ncbi:hypothetical protein [uncultured Halomonas sp.]|uniref:hypothetical protein n=1 Tax=uncultured Halomonas sp. TaxID=173971 RepID=UPI00262AA1A4|nr:hypothetical protein [uncultured Halomonas sp.]